MAILPPSTTPVVEKSAETGYVTVMDRDQIIKRLAALRKELGEGGVEHLAIFGSRARGDHREESDLDILVEVAPDAKFSILDLVGVQHIVERETGLPTNPMMRRSLDDRFRNAIRPDIIDVF